MMLATIIIISLVTRSENEKRDQKCLISKESNINNLKFIFVYMYFYQSYLMRVDTFPNIDSYGIGVGAEQV
jgi:hypothetical protein